MPDRWREGRFSGPILISGAKELDEWFGPEVVNKRSAEGREIIVFRSIGARPTGWLACLELAVIVS
jgi:hypothetical protein